MDKRKVNITISIRGTADDKTAREIEKAAFQFLKANPDGKIKKRLRL